MFGFTQNEIKIFKSLTSPKKIQDFLETLEINFEEKGETCFSPRIVLQKKKANCIEGALFAATALRFHGHKPLIVDLVSGGIDEDHVIAVFKQHHWGALSKTNHAVLRYREPIYKSIREVVMSYFHEYFLDDGKKNLRAYSSPINLSKFDKKGWMTTREHVWYIRDYLYTIPHKKILSRSQISGLRKADPVEIEAGKITQWKPKKLLNNNGSK